MTVRGLMSRNDVPLTLVQLRTMEDILRNSLLVTRAVSNIVMTIGILAVLLAAVGLYGVVSYVMAGRTREFGIRLALGANPSSITRLVLGYGMRLAVIGGAAGIILGLVALRLIGGPTTPRWRGAVRSPSACMTAARTVPTWCRTRICPSCSPSPTSSSSRIAPNRNRVVAFIWPPATSGPG